MRNKRGQSTLEYVIILTAVVAAILVVAAKGVGPKVASSMNGTVEKMGAKVDTIGFGAVEE